MVHQLHASGSVIAPELNFFGFTPTNRSRSYLLCLIFVTVFALIAKNLVRGNIGRQWMAIRDMDIAAELIGIRPLYAKLTGIRDLLFHRRRRGRAVGVRLSGLLGAARLQHRPLVPVPVYGHYRRAWARSSGSFLGAAFILVLPILLDQVPHALGIPLSVETVTLLVFIVTGALICWLLIVEPHGFARLWSTGKEKLRLWPYPY